MSQERAESDTNRETTEGDADEQTAEGDADEQTADGDTEQTPGGLASRLSGLADATDEETAAIVAAITAHLAERERAAAAAAGAHEGTGDETRRHWAFVGRLAGVGVHARRSPRSTPPDDWTAAGRADRF